MSDRVERAPVLALWESGIDEIIDVRAPEEYAMDHISGSINLPVLDDTQRAEVGTLHRQKGPFDARKVGAGWVAANIGRHLSDHFAGKGKTYRPAVYCWRGGQRSRSMATVLSEVGWRPLVVEGGYKAYRRHVMDVMELAGEFRWRVLNGFTGSGKTLVLQALRERGAQVLDLEGLANHKGSLFGGNPAKPQPTQKRFESLIRDAVVSFDRGPSVFVEAESPKIGHLNLPAPLWRVMRDSAVTKIQATLEARTDYLHGDYASWIGDPAKILKTIERLRPFHSGEQIERWRQDCLQQAWKPLIASLLREHYDRRYGAGGSGHYNVPDRRVALECHDAQSVAACADELLSQEADRS